MRKTPLFAALLGAFLSVASAWAQSTEPANYPTWWYDGSIPGVSIVSNDGSGATANNYAPVNLGQLKWVATRAKAYLDVQLASQGGSQIDLTTLFPAMPPATDPGYAAAVQANYAPANLGQLKALAQLFYVRLNLAGYDTNAYLLTQGYPASWTSPYPWPVGGDVSLNYAPANLGQVKLAFGFDLNGFTSGTGNGTGNVGGATMPGDDNDLGATPAYVVSGLSDSAGNAIPGVVELPAGAGPTVSGSAPNALQVYTPFSQSL